MHLEHLFDFSAPLSQPVDIGAVPLGNRVVVNILGGEFHGPRLSGKVLPSGGDCALVVPGGYLHSDARAILETDDGARIYMTYTARVAFTPALRRVLFEAQGETDFGENYWIAQLQFETSDKRYAWLNHLMAAGEGRLRPGPEASYRVYALESN